jgi:hypothetical protein
MSAAVVVRDAVLADAARCARIYAGRGEDVSELPLRRDT